MRIDEIDEKILLALKNGPKKIREIALLVGDRVAKRRIQKLLNYGFLKRIRQGIYGLDSKGKHYIEKEISVDKLLSIGQDLWNKVSAFIINKVPTEVYQAVVRLTLSGMRAKQSEIFTNFKNQFNSGWSGVLLAGKPKAIKTPLGELICMIVGLDPEEHKFPITGTKSDFGVAYQEKGGVWKYRPSPWHKKPIVIIDDWHRIIRKDAKQTALSLAHGSRTFIRYGQTFPNYPVPFITLNTHTKTAFQTIAKIIKEIGDEYIKRLVVVNVDYIAPYLEDAAILTRKMLRSIPKLNFKAFPVKKKELTDPEFTLLCEILKEATDPHKSEFFDERSVELLVLGRYVLAKNRDIIETIYQTCWDRLLCLETLGVTKQNWKEFFSRKWKEYLSTEQPKLSEQLQKEEKKEEKRKKKIEQSEEEIAQQEEKKSREGLYFLKKTGKLEAGLRELRDNLPSPKMREGGWGNKQIPIRKQINSVLYGLKMARTDDKLQICENQYLYLKSECEDFMDEYTAWERKQEKGKREKEELKQALKARKHTLVGPFQDLGKEFNNFRLEKEKPIVKETKKLINETVEKIQVAKNTQELEEMETPLSTMKSLLDLIKGGKVSLPLRRKILEEKLKILEQRRELVQEVQNYIKKLDKFGRQEEKNEVGKVKEGIEELLSEIYQVDSQMSLTLLEPDLSISKQRVDSLVSKFKLTRDKQKTQEEDQKQAYKEQIQVQRQINKLQKEKAKIKEQLNKDLFRKENLSSSERAILETLEGYRQRKRVPTNNLTSFFEKLGLVKRINSSDVLQNGFNEGATYEACLAIDEHVYPLNHFNKWDWNQAKLFIQIRIDQLRDKAIKERNKELAKQWDLLDKKEQTLKSPLYYIRTDRRLVQARYLGKKEDQRLHFKFEDGTVWTLPKGREWTIYTKIEDGGKLFSFISNKESTVVVQTNKGKREISKDRLFCYIYEYKGRKPI